MSDLTYDGVPFELGSTVYKLLHNLTIIPINTSPPANASWVADVEHGVVYVTDNGKSRHWFTINGVYSSLKAAQKKEDRTAPKRH